MTVQKRAVLEALAVREDHPTAEQIYKDAHRNIPGISRATVYRILNTLVKMNIARKVFHPGDFARFETKVFRHHHLVCRKCEKIMDIGDLELKPIPLPQVKSVGFNVDDYSINFFGECSNCNPVQSKSKGVSHVRKR